MDYMQQQACHHSSLTWLQIRFLTWEQQLLATLQPPQQASQQYLRFVMPNTFIISDFLILGIDFQTGSHTQFRKL
jgi:hypothetical protein